MSRPQRQKRASDGPPSNEWMVTFSDCMTLLLTFFVMLLSFSSFDQEDLTHVFEGFDLASQSSPFDDPRPPKESFLPDNDMLLDRTENGAEFPSAELIEPNRVPRAPMDPLGDDAYSDRRVLSIPSDLLFWGRGDSLKPQAAEVLGHVADFLRAMPCRVVIRETPGPGLTQSLCLKRSLAIMKFLAQSENLDAGRLAVSAAPDGPDAAPEAIVRIAMLNSKVYP